MGCRGCLRSLMLGGWDYLIWCELMGFGEDITTRISLHLLYDLAAVFNYNDLTATWLEWWWVSRGNYPKVVNFASEFELIQMVLLCFTWGSSSKYKWLYHHRCLKVDGISWGLNGSPWFTPNWGLFMGKNGRPLYSGWCKMTPSHGWDGLWHWVYHYIYIYNKYIYIYMYTILCFTIPPINIDPAK